MQFNLDDNLKSTCSQRASERGNGQQIFSYTLFGKNQLKFVDGVKENLRGIKKFYPGAIMRLYYEYSSNQLNSIQRKLCQSFCQEANFDLCNVNNSS